MQIKVKEEHTGVDHELRWDGGRKIEWVAPDGTVRIPEETQRKLPYPAPFTAAGKPYPNWSALCAEGEGYFRKDLYGREVFYISERFPCFDSYDYANENRYYRWFFLKENGKLTRVYYADGRNVIEVTEDVSGVENKCREIMIRENWLK